MDNALLRKINDLNNLAVKKYTFVGGKFLTPAEQADLAGYRPIAGTRFLLFGGDEAAERRLPVFYPDYYTEEELPGDELIAVAKIRVHGTEVTVTHRDVLGAVLATGITRESVGDIRLEGGDIWVYGLPVPVENIVSSLTSVGRAKVSTEKVGLKDVPAPKVKTESAVFTVAGLRLDSVTAGMFGISRSDAAEAIRAGLVCLNYRENCNPDSKVTQGDVISLRGKGKGTLAEISGLSKKGRIFIRTERAV